MAGILSAPEDDHRAARRERLTLAAMLAGLLALWLPGRRCRCCSASAP